MGSACNNDTFQPGVITYSTHNRVEYVEHHCHTRSGISELVLHLTLSIEWIGRYDNCASSQRAIIGDGILRNIWQSNSNPVAFFYTQALETGGKAISQGRKLGIT